MILYQSRSKKTDFRMGLDLSELLGREWVAFRRSEFLIMLGNQEESIRPPGKDAKDSRTYTSDGRLDFIPAPRARNSPR